MSPPEGPRRGRAGAPRGVEDGRFDHRSRAPRAAASPTSTTSDFLSLPNTMFSSPGIIGLIASGHFKRSSPAWLPGVLTGIRAPGERTFFALLQTLISQAHFGLVRKGRKASVGDGNPPFYGARWHTRRTLPVCDERLLADVASGPHKFAHREHIIVPCHIVCHSLDAPDASDASSRLCTLRTRCAASSTASCCAACLTRSCAYLRQSMRALASVVVHLDADEARVRSGRGRRAFTAVCRSFPVTNVIVRIPTILETPSLYPLVMQHAFVDVMTC